MKNIFIGLVLSVTALVCMPAWSSCNTGSSEPKPEWVSNMDYSLPGYIVGVGYAEKDGKSEQQQKMDSERDAKMHLVEQIRVTIKSANEQSTRVNNEQVQKDALSQVAVNAEEVLRGLRIKSRWVDKETCTLYSLLIISNEAVAQTRQERLMKTRLEQIKNLLAAGGDNDKNLDIKTRRKHLEDAQTLLADTDFSLLSEELGKAVYAGKISAALEKLNKESAQAQGRMALFAINKDGILSARLLGKMLDKLRSGDIKTDRLMAECKHEEDCISRAKERGFTLLTLLNASTQVVASQMGTLKGTLTLSKTVYDIESRKVMQGPDTVSAQIIGWSNAELDWDVAADKAIQSIK